MTSLALAALFAGATACVACGACGKAPAGGPSASAAVPGAEPSSSRTAAPVDSGVAAVRDVAMWTHAKDGTTEDLAALAAHEGAAGLVEAAADPELRQTAVSAMAFARGYAQLPFLAEVVAAPPEEEALLAASAVVEIAARPRASEDLEDAAELAVGCTRLGALARDPAAKRDRRVPALRALRMLPCPPGAALPADLDAR